MLNGARAVGVLVVLSALLALGATAATSPTKPSNTAPPTISGNIAVGQTLTATTGTWNGTTPITYSYQWARNNASGGFDPITNATQATYSLTTADAGHKLFVQVKAQNTAGVAWQSSKPTTSVGGVAANATLPVSAVSLPDRLVISGLDFTPLAPTTTGRVPVQARFQVTDMSGHPVQGALVKEIGLPYAWVQNSPEQMTGSDGWVSLQVTPTVHMPKSMKHITMFVRARKPGGKLLAGISTRRLVQASVAPSL
jgi:hypothetical protein